MCMGVVVEVELRQGKGPIRSELSNQTTVASYKTRTGDATEEVIEEGSGRK